MSESAKAALAARSASAARSAGTRRNSLFDAGHIQLSSISNGFSSSCTLCRLHTAARVQLCNTTNVSSIHRGHVGCRLDDAHFGNLHDSLLAGHLLQLQPLYLRLRCLAALADRCAEVPLRRCIQQAWSAFAHHAQCNAVLGTTLGGMRTSPVPDGSTIYSCGPLF